jgi:hypothetical protein
MEARVVVDWRWAVDRGGRDRKAPQMPKMGSSLESPRKICV